MISEARLAANRRNAARSTGPKTAEGKTASRRNALKHGLTGMAIDLDDARVVAERTATLDADHPPRWSWQTWVSGEVAGITRRLDRLHQEEAKLRDLGVYQALATWDDDRRLDVANLGARLAADPVRVVLQLRATPHGCDWLIERWTLLAHLADEGEAASGGGWTSAQRCLAFDLLGTPPEARPTVLGLRFDEQGRAGGPTRSDGEVARDTLAELLIHRAEVIDSDVVARALAEQGLEGDTALALRRLRRYEGALHRRLVWCVEQLDGADPNPPEESLPRLRWALSSTPSPAESVSPPSSVPPWPSLACGIELPEPPDFPPRPYGSRVVARLRQAESRRDRKRRKRDRRRG